VPPNGILDVSCEVYGIVTLWMVIGCIVHWSLIWLRFNSCINFHGVDVLSFSCGIWKFYKTVSCSYGVLVFYWCLLNY
jgi:hypothetical protein